MRVIARNHDLTEEARQGYAGCENPNLATSAAWYAHELGAFMWRTGKTEPKDVRMGQGSTIWANDMRFKPIERPGAPITFDRVC